MLSLFPNKGRNSIVVRYPHWLGRSESNGFCTFKSINSTEQKNMNIKNIIQIITGCLIIGALGYLINQSINN